MLRKTRYVPPKPIPPWTGPKPPLKMLVTPICRVHHLDLQAYLEKVYGIREYDTRAATGAGPGMTPEFVVTRDLPDTPNIWQQVDSVRRGRRVRNLPLILNLLCRDEFIPAGMYVIDMSKGPNPVDMYRDALHSTSNPLSAECMRIKEANKKNQDFVKTVAALDLRAKEYASKLQSKRT